MDVNVLIALLDSDHVSHTQTASWFAQNAQKGWASCPLTQGKRQSPAACACALTGRGPAADRHHASKRRTFASNFDSRSAGRFRARSRRLRSADAETRAGASTSRILNCSANLTASSTTAAFRRCRRESSVRGRRCCTEPHGRRGRFTVVCASSAPPALRDLSRDSCETRRYARPGRELSLRGCCRSR